MTDEARSYERITLDDLARLAQIARRDREDRFTRRPRWRPYADRVLCVALCQGAALHYVDGRNGVKDFARRPELVSVELSWPPVSDGHRPRLSVLALGRGERAPPLVATP